MSITFFHSSINYFWCQNEVFLTSNDYSGNLTGRKFVPTNPAKELWWNLPWHEIVVFLCYKSFQIKNFLSFCQLVSFVVICFICFITRNYLVIICITGASATLEQKKSCLQRSNRQMQKRWLSQSLSKQWAVQNQHSSAAISINSIL